MYKVTATFLASNKSLYRDLLSKVVSGYDNQWVLNGTQFVQWQSQTLSYQELLAHAHDSIDIVLAEQLEIELIAIG